MYLELFGYRVFGDFTPCKSFISKQLFNLEYSNLLILSCFTIRLKSFLIYKRNIKFSGFLKKATTPRSSLSLQKTYDVLVYKLRL